MPIRRASPPAPSRPLPTPGQQAQRRGGVVRITYQGPGDDARLWDLLAMDPRGANLTDAWEGWRQAKPTFSTATATGVDGQRYRSHRFGPRSMTLPVLLQHDGSSDDMWDLWDSWHRSWSYSDPGTLTVETSWGSARTIGLRLEEFVHDESRDPIADGLALVAVGCVADDPHWSGRPIPRSFEAPAASKTMFDTAGTGNVLNIGSGHTFDVAAIDNPGDFAVRPDWTVKAPWTTVTLGVGDKTLRYPVASTTPNDVLTITTSGGSPAVWLDHGDGVRINVTASLSQWGFAAVPPGKEVPITVQLDGGGAVECTLTPRYLRPF